MPVNANSAGVAYEAFFVFQDSPRSEMAITDDILEINISRELAGFNRSLRAGTAEITLFNADGRYSPRRTDSPFFGELKPNLEIRIQGMISSGSPFILDTSQLDCGDTLATAQVLFTGFADSFTVRPALSDPRNVTIRCRDSLKEMLRRRVTTDILTNVNVSSVYTTILSLAGVPSDSRSVDTIAETREFVWFRDVLFLNALEEITESGAYSVFVAGDGTVGVKNRFFDVGQEVVASYDQLRSLSFSVSEREIVNDVLVRGFPRTIANSIQVVAQIVQPIEIPSSGSVGFFIDYLDPRNQELAPAISMQAPVSSQDYLTFTNSDGTGTNRTSTTTVAVAFFAETAVQTVTNLSSGTIFLTKYQLRGDPILRFPAIAVTRQDSGSIFDFGVKDFSTENRLLGSRSSIEALADYVIDVFSDPTDEISFSLVNRYPDVLTNELAKLVHITNSHVGIANQFVVRGIDHTITADQVGWVHQVNYNLLQSLVAAVFILDSSESGILDTNRLGSP